jgi:hypothetical protein
VRLQHGELAGFDANVLPQIHRQQAIPFGPFAITLYCDYGLYHLLELIGQLRKRL